MSQLPNEEIEGRLNAQREVLACLVVHVARMEQVGGRAPDGLLDVLEAHVPFQDHQEDPGAVPSGPAFAIEGAMMREFRLILRQARGRLAELRQARGRLAEPDR